MSDKEKIDLRDFLPKLRDQMWEKMVRIKDGYPLLVDYLDLEINELEEQFNDYQKKSPINAEDEAMLFYNYTRVNRNLSKIEHGRFPYLWDEKLYNLMKKASESNLGITNNWVKVLLASNLLELSLNQTLINKNHDLFEKLKKDNANIVKKTEEVNKILEHENREELKRSDINFIRCHRVDVDHPISKFIKELTPKDANDVIEKVHESLKKLQPLLEENSDSSFKAEILDKGPFHRGDTFHTKIKFKGKLVSGFFDNRIDAPKGTTFPGGGTTWWCADPSNAPDPMDEPGKLVGEDQWESTWACKIGNDYPIGQYTVNICVYDHLGPKNRPVVKEKTITIEVVQ